MDAQDSEVPKPSRISNLTDELTESDDIDVDDTEEVEQIKLELKDEIDVEQKLLAVEELIAQIEQMGWFQTHSTFIFKTYSFNI